MSYNDKVIRKFILKHQCAYLATQGPTHAQIQKVLPKGIQLWKRFFYEGKRDNPNTTKSGPLSAHQRNTI